MEEEEKPVNEEDEEKVTDDLDKGSDEENLIGLPITYAIVAMVGGAVLLTLIIGLLIYCLCCRQRNSKKDKIVLMTSSSVDTNSERLNGDGGPGSASKLRPPEPEKKEEINEDNEA